MAIDDSTSHNNDAVLFKSRLSAVLDYDKIPVQKRAAHLSKLCGMSVSTARRILSVKETIAPHKNHRWLFEISAGLDVHWCWLHNGSFQSFEPRTAKIQMLMFDGETEAEADRVINSIAAEIPGKPMYVNLPMRGATGEHLGDSLSLVVLIEQHRRLTEWEKNKNLRFMIRLMNKDTKAERLLEMVARGQITKQQVFRMV